MMMPAKKERFSLASCSFPTVAFAVILVFAAVSNITFLHSLNGRESIASPPPSSDDNDHSPRLQIDDLVWHTPRPREPRRVGWEDEYIHAFKKEHYIPSQRLRCQEEPSSPYGIDKLVCPVPAYVPARLNLPGSTQDIPRVIYLSWTTRKLGRAMFTSVMSLLLHNPEYELLFFTDEDVDRYICAKHPDWSHDFSRIESGAGRTDVWRLMMMKDYGGVYLDADISGLGHLPIRARDHVVSGAGGWTHLPHSISPAKGLLEHWALAFVPDHPLIVTTLDIIRENFREYHPDIANDANDSVHGREASDAEGSFTIRHTGPGPYQRALHQLLRRCNCQVVDGSYLPALRNPSMYCSKPMFENLFGNLVITQGLNMNHTLTNKLLSNEIEEDILEHNYDYDAGTTKEALPRLVARPHFCAKEEIEARAKKLELLWEEETEAADYSETEGRTALTEKE